MVVNLVDSHTVSRLSYSPAFLSSQVSPKSLESHVPCPLTLSLPMELTFPSSDLTQQTVLGKGFPNESTVLGTQA